MKTRKKISRLRLAFILLVAFSTTLLTACGGGATGTDAESGSVYIGLTDAEGDFTSYTVDVTSLKLTKASGAVVETLPLTTTVDFAQYVEVTELLTAATIPSGVYTQASMTLDYRNANIVVQNENGEAIVANVVDEHGAPIETLTVNMQINDRGFFYIRPGLPARITLDFDLDASNDITISGSTASVSVSPVVLADTLLEEAKPLRLRGLLNQVDASDDSFNINLRPFKLHSGLFGQAPVHVSNTTVYEIDGVSYQGNDGLNTLATLPASTPLIAQAIYNRDEHQFEANEVYAGSSVPWGESDVLKGTVVARTGNELTVKGATIELANGQRSYNDEVTVLLDNSTTVTRQGDGLAMFDINDVSVGSHIYAMGALSGNTLDLSDGHVRLTRTWVSGNVVSVSPLVVDTFAINARLSNAYDFSGTGFDAANDADPDNYQIETATLSLATLQVNDPVRVRGFVNTFGSAPADLNAQTVIDASEVRAHFVVNFTEGSSNYLASITETGLLVNLTNAKTRHHIVQAGIPTNLNDLTATPWLNSAGQPGLYAIVGNGAINVYVYYEDFVSALQASLNEGSSVKRIDAAEYFNGMTFNTKRLRVRLN